MVLSEMQTEKVFNFETIKSLSVSRSFPAFPSKIPANSQQNPRIPQNSP